MWTMRTSEREQRDVAVQALDDETRPARGLQATDVRDAEGDARPSTAAA